MIWGDNMADEMKNDTNDEQHHDIGSKQSETESLHDAERTWRMVALAAAGVLVVAGAVCVGVKGNSSSNVDKSSKVKIINGKGNTKSVARNDEKKDEAYSIDSPLPEDRINEKIEEVCPNETYIIKDRHVGTDTAGNPYADYECSVTSGRNITFTAKDYVVEKNGQKQRKFYCDYTKQVAAFHCKDVENVLKDNHIDYAIEQDGITYDVKVADNQTREKFSNAFVKISDDYAKSESNYNKSKWIDDTKIISFFVSGNNNNNVTFTCTSDTPNAISIADDIRTTSATQNGRRSKTSLQRLVEQYNDVDEQSFDSKKTSLQRLVEQYNESSKKNDRNGKTALERLIEHYKSDDISSRNNKTAIERLIKQYNNDTDKTQKASLVSSLDESSEKNIDSRIGGAERLRNDLLGDTGDVL